MRTVFIIASVLLTTATFSQSIFNGDLLYVGSQTNLYVADSVINNGTIENNGNIQIGGIWQNNATYLPGTGQLTLVSDLPQIINHNNQSFTRLTIDGGGVKTFGADIHIENELILTNGLLQSANDAKIIIEDGAVISGSSENSYIAGWLYHTGTGSKFYPIGTASQYLPVELTDVTGTSPVLGFRAAEAEMNYGFLGPITAVSDQYYWENDLLSGSFDGSLITVPIINELTLLDSIEQAVVAQSTSLSADFENIGVSDVTGDVVTGLITSNDPVTMAFITIGRIDPVPLGEINVYNAVSPNNDGRNDVFKIAGITAFENNSVAIYTRWGDRVYQATGYDNNEVVFSGTSNTGKTYQLPEGTYYYVIDKGDGSQKVSGYLELRY